MQVFNLTGQDVNLARKIVWLYFRLFLWDTKVIFRYDFVASLRLKTICSSTREYDKSCDTIKQKFLDTQHQKEITIEQMKK